MNTQDNLQAHAAETAGKVPAALMSVAMIGAVLWPIQQNWRDKPRDNFPLSYYPMFSSRRKATETFYYLVGRDERGARHYVRHKLIGPGGGNQVRRQLRRIINEGRAPKLAQSVAKRLARQNEPPWSEIVSVDVCIGRIVVDDFFHGRKAPVREQVQGSCTVERNSQ